MLEHKVKVGSDLDLLGVELELFAVSLAPDEVHSTTNPRQLKSARTLSEPLAKIPDVFKDLQNDKLHVIAIAPDDFVLRKQVRRIRPDLLRVLERSWNREYYGSSHRILLDNIHSDPRESPSCNTGAIVQSSGYGKSRTVDELAKLVFTIPMNTRAEAETEQGAYPTPDTNIASSILTQAGEVDELKVERALQIFFCTLFNQIVAELDTIQLDPHLPVEDFATQWREHLLQDDNRSKLYSRVINKTEEEWSRREQAYLPSSDKSKSDAKAALKRLISRVPAIGAGPGKPALSVVMYVDAAHELDIQSNINTTARVTLYDFFTQAVSDYGSAFFVLFVSTVARRPDPTLAGWTTVLPSRLLSSYTDMPFDCHPTLSTRSLGNLTLKDVQEYSFLIPSGRPLFWSMFEQMANSYRDAKTRDFAIQKLTCSTSGSHLERPAMLALLDTILNMEYHRFTQQALLMEEMVASHMRTAYYVPRHQEYLETGCTSEPVLADAAMHALDSAEDSAKEPSLYNCSAERRGVAADAAAAFLSSLHTGPTDGMINMGQRGENVAKMLLVRAYMSAIKAQCPGFQRNWSSGCSLVSFLQSLARKDFQDLVLDCKPNNLPSADGQPLQDAFAKSWVRFTHFVRADDEGGLFTSAAGSAFIRGAGIIACPPNSVYVSIPVLLDSSKPITEANMSSILVQIKLRSRQRSNDTDAREIEMFPPPGSSRDGTKMAKLDVELAEKYRTRPYISLHMNFGVEKQRDAPPAQAQTNSDQPSTSSSSGPCIGVVARTPPTKTTSRGAPKARVHPRYTLFFYGCTSEVYGCISEDAEKMYKDLLGLSDIIIPGRTHPGTMSRVLRMKPVWQTTPGNSSFDWFGDPWLQGHNQPEEDDISGEEEEEVSEEEDEEVSEEEEVEDMELENEDPEDKRQGLGAVVDQLRYWHLDIV